MKLDTGQKSRQLLLYIFAILGAAAAVVYGGLLSAGNAVPTVRAQQDPFLAQRINQIEQRFTSLETRLIRLEQESRLPSVTPRLPDYNNADAEIRLLRSQLEILRLRVEEAECGLIRLDERTLGADARQARNKAEGAARTDVCRSTPAAPLELSARP